MVNRSLLCRFTPKTNFAVKSKVSIAVSSEVAHPPPLPVSECTLTDVACCKAVGLFSSFLAEIVTVLVAASEPELLKRIQASMMATDLSSLVSMNIVILLANSCAFLSQTIRSQFLDLFETQHINYSDFPVVLEGIKHKRKCHLCEKIIDLIAIMYSIADTQSDSFAFVHCILSLKFWGSR
jgi:hypothetical protein